jgi:hypothetical protein
LTSQDAALRFVMAKLVVVALVVVEFCAVKFCNVVEPERRRFVSDASPELESVLRDALPETLRLVVVALVVVEFPVMTRLPLKVEDAEMRMPSVVVGESAPFTMFQSFWFSERRPSDEVAVRA